MTKEVIFSGNVKNLPINKLGDLGTLLQRATRSGNLPTMMVLLERGCNVNAKGSVSVDFKWRSEAFFVCNFRSGTSNTAYEKRN